MSDLTMTVGELVAAAPGLQAIGEYAIPSVIASYALKKSKIKASAELLTIEAQRIELNEKHAKKDGAGVSVKVGNQYQLADVVAFQLDWAALLAESVTLHGVRAVTARELEGAARVVDTEPGKPPEIVRGIPSDVLFALGPFVTEPSE